MNHSVVRLLYLLLILLLFSCRSENEEDLFGISLNGDCDTTYVNYNPVIKTVFDNKCVSCHRMDGVPGCNLDSFPSIINYISSHGDVLYTKVKNNDHQGVFLTTCESKQLKKWMQNPAD
jgi:hypothetical protein